jgi:FtsH-binding integral membrane protein
MTDPSTSAPHRSRGRLYLVLGLGLAVLGVVLYMVLFSLQRLTMPWYMPVMALLGVILVGLSMFERRTVWRSLALLAVVLLAGTEIAFLYAVRLPPYTGPIAEGLPFPAFESKLFNGGSFTQRDLIGERSSLLVFFRGRW